MYIKLSEKIVVGYPRYIEILIPVDAGRGRIVVDLAEGQTPDRLMKN
jgi:hypothetical protein